MSSVTFYLCQHLIWIKFQQEYFLEFPNVRLCQFMVTTPAITSPLERSYTKFQLVAAKRRNHFISENLEVLYLLAALNHSCLPRATTEHDAEIKKLVWFIDIFRLFLLLCWKQSSRGVLMKMCSERYAVNLQENAHAWQLYRNHTLALVFSWELRRGVEDVTITGEGFLC